MGERRRAEANAAPAARCARAAARPAAGWLRAWERIAAGVAARGAALGVCGRGAEPTTARVTSRRASVRVAVERAWAEVGAGSGRIPVAAAGLGSGLNGSPACAECAAALAAKTAMTAATTFGAGITRANKSPSRPDVLPSRCSWSTLLTFASDFNSRDSRERGEPSESARRFPPAPFEASVARSACLRLAAHLLE
jgi:hypothetical protein